MSDQPVSQPGLIILFGSGETSPTGQKIFDSILKTLPPSPSLALLETPAGFELNSFQVIQRVAEVFSHNLKNFSPKVQIIPARKRGTFYSPDELEIVTPLLSADMIFLGPGSPTYAVRQLKDSLAWYYLVARHRLGAALAFASAATIAISSYALPVYEIYKVGEDLHWKDGLGLLKPYGFDLVFVPHWNNRQGRAELDTSRCFIGKERFSQLVDMLPLETTIIGIDEKTALVINPNGWDCRVYGLGSVTILHKGLTYQFLAGECFSMGQYADNAQCFPSSDIPPHVWVKAIEMKSVPHQLVSTQPPMELIQLVQAREAARHCKNWTMADEIRKQIENLGWEVRDTPNGPVFHKVIFN